MGRLGGLLKLGPSFGEQGSSSGRYAYRHVSGPEVARSLRTGRVPNVSPGGSKKPVYYSPEQYYSTLSAERGLQVGLKNPQGATFRPTHRITARAADARWYSGGNVEGGTGTEFITFESLPVFRIDPLSAEFVIWLDPSQE